MHWIDEYEADILSLDYPGPAGAQADLEEMIRTGTIPREVEEMLEPFMDGSLDPGDLEALEAREWARYRDEEIETAKHQVMLHARLRDFYTRMLSASEEDWMTYTRLVVRARLNQSAPMMAAMMSMSRSFTPSVVDEPPV